VLPAVSGSELVGGETITLGDEDRRRYHATSVDDWAADGFTDGSAGLAGGMTTDGVVLAGAIFVGEWVDYLGLLDRSKVEIAGSI
jgi:hypothetical protein